MLEKSKTNLENNMTCHKCGINNDYDSKFCIKCGSKLNDIKINGSVDLYFAKQNNGCQMCGSLVPTRQVSFNQNIGYVFARSYSSLKGRLCKKCIDKEFKKMTLITLFLGWWGTISFLVTPFYLIGNLYNFGRSIGMNKE